MKNSRKNTEICSTGRISRFSRKVLDAVLFASVFAVLGLIFAPNFFAKTEKIDAATPNDIPQPTITSVSSNTCAVNSTCAQITITGTNFLAGASKYISGTSGALKTRDLDCVQNGLLFLYDAKNNNGSMNSEAFDSTGYYMVNVLNPSDDAEAGFLMVGTEGQTSDNVVWSGAWTDNPGALTFKSASSATTNVNWVKGSAKPSFRPATLTVEAAFKNTSNTIPMGEETIIGNWEAGGGGITTTGGNNFGYMGANWYVGNAYPDVLSPNSFSRNGQLYSDSATVDSATNPNLGFRENSALATTATSGNFTYSAKTAIPWAVGANPGSGSNVNAPVGQNFQGLFYAARLYDRPLTYAERAQNYIVDTQRFFGQTIEQISGMNVTVGGAACENFTVLSDTEATCVPASSANSGQVDVSLANIFGQSATATSAYTYLTTHTVFFSGNGGKPLFNSQSVVDGSSASPISDPTMSNCTFGGWFTDNGTFANPFIFANGGNSAADGNGTPTVVNADLTVFAKFTCPITYFANAPSGSSATVPAAGSYVVKGSSNIILAGKITDANANAYFKKWNTVADGSGTSYGGNIYNGGDPAGQSVAQSSLPAGGLNLYAQWTSVTLTVSNTCDADQVSFSANMNTFSSAPQHCIFYAYTDNPDGMHVTAKSLNSGSLVKTDDSSQKIPSKPNGFSTINGNSRTWGVAYLLETYDNPYYDSPYQTCAGIYQTDPTSPANFACGGSGYATTPLQESSVPASAYQWHSLNDYIGDFNNHSAATYSVVSETMFGAGVGTAPSGTYQDSLLYTAVAEP